MKSLFDLYREHQGKVSDKWSIYLVEYDRLFSSYREQPVRMLEIGIQNGGSLEIWSKYFPNAQALIGCDINPDCAKLTYGDPRIKVVVGDANTDVSESVILGHSATFDLIIDDGSHTSSDIAKSFARYFRHLNDGGLFVAEDLHCSYWQEFEGGLYYPYSSMAFFKRLADVVNHEHWGIEKERRQLLQGFTEKFSIEFDEDELAKMHSIEFFSSVCVVRKHQASSNVLGERFIAGDQELVVPGHHGLSGSLQTRMSQASNSWAAMDLAPEETWQQLTRQIASLNQALAEGDLQVASLHQVVAERDRLINSVLSSSSWKLTRPLRWLGRHVRSWRLDLKAITRSISEVRSRKNVLAKIAEVYKSEGWHGVVFRVRRFLDRHSFQSSVSFNSNFKLPNDSLKKRSKEVVRHHQSVDIIVCVHNALDDVKRCLESVVCNTYPPYQIIIVDDGSSLETKEYLQSFVYGQSVTLIRNEEATGYTKAANTGLRATSGDFAVLLNSDTIVPPLWLDRLIECANSATEIGMIGPLSNTASWQSVPEILNERGDWADNPLPTGWAINDYSVEVARVSPRIYPRVGFLNGFCILIKRQLINDIGLFDEVIFARGYGEENDYSLRATERNWQLAVADDCYVFHAQSKSYSHERRAELARLAGLALAEKHGHARIEHNLSMTKSHPSMHYLRRRCSEIERMSSLAAEAQDRFEGKRLLFLLPAANSGGGGNIVLLEAACMRSFGVDAWVANLDAYRQHFEESHPDIDVPVFYLETPDALSKIAQNFDAVIATLYSTVFWMKPLLNTDRCPILGYYIQDFEPDFFREGSADYKAALASYTTIPELRQFTKTKWNQKRVHHKTGVLPTLVGPSLDIDRFHPAPISRAGEGNVNILAMVRPDTPRRAPLMTMSVLKRLARKFGLGVRITIFGVDARDPKFLNYSSDFMHFNLGAITSQSVATAFSDADVFLDCSVFQAMGLTAMEAMASGVAVVGPINGGLQEIIVDGYNGLLVDTQDEDAICAAAERLVTDNKLRKQIQQNALEVLSYTPIVSSVRILDCLFQDNKQFVEA